MALVFNGPLVRGAIRDAVADAIEEGPPTNNFHFVLKEGVQEIVRMPLSSADIVGSYWIIIEGNEVPAAVTGTPDVYGIYNRNDELVLSGSVTTPGNGGEIVNFHPGGVIVQGDMVALEWEYYVGTV